MTFWKTVNENNLKYFHLMDIQPCSPYMNLKYIHTCRCEKFKEDGFVFNI
jgi:hypothetical protein